VFCEPTYGIPDESPSDARDGSATRSFQCRGCQRSCTLAVGQSSSVRCNARSRPLGTTEQRYSLNELIDLLEACFKRLQYGIENTAYDLWKSKLELRRIVSLVVLYVQTERI
jgi:hypothetical protein